MRDLHFKEDEEPTVRLFQSERKYQSNIEQPLLSRHQGSLKTSKLTAPLYRSSQMSSKKHVPKYSVKVQCQNCNFYGYSHVEERRNVYIRRFTIVAMIVTLVLFVTGLLYIDSGFSTLVEIMLYTNLGCLFVAIMGFLILLVRRGHRIDHFCMKCAKQF